jgi:hypothetical protein
VLPSTPEKLTRELFSRVGRQKNEAPPKHEMTRRWRFTATVYHAPCPPVETHTSLHAGPHHDSRYIIRTLS